MTARERQKRNRFILRENNNFARDHAFLYVSLPLACENIRFSSLFATGDDVPSRETSPAAKSEEKRMFSQATLPSLRDYDVKLPNFTFYGGRFKTSDDEFFCLFLNLSAGPK